MVRDLDVFERNRVPFELKVLELAFYIHQALGGLLEHYLRYIKSLRKLLEVG